MRALVLVVLLTACTEEMPPCPTVYEDPGPSAAHGLITTDPDILPQAECAAARWTNATGIAVRGGERAEGRNVELKWWSGPSDGTDIIGEYVPKTQTILIKDTLPGKFVFPALVAHEVGHALEDSGEHIAATMDGLMTPNDLEDQAITKADLRLVCGQAECAAEHPEN